MGHLEREQAIHPLVVGVVGVAVVHPVELETVGAAAKRLSGHELSQRVGVGGVETLVGVEREDPVRPQVCSCGEEPVSIAPVVPAEIAVAALVRDDGRDERVSGEDRARSVRAAVVERDDRVSERRRLVEPARQHVCGVADGQEADDARLALIRFPADAVHCVSRVATRPRATSVDVVSSPTTCSTEATPRSHVYRLS